LAEESGETQMRWTAVPRSGATARVVVAASVAAPAALRRRYAARRRHTVGSHKSPLALRELTPADATRRLPRCHCLQHCLVGPHRVLIGSDIPIPNN